MAYKTGSRGQYTMLPPVIEEYVSKEDPVRVYDAFVEALDFYDLGIKIESCKSGAHEYYPRDMLKLILYGYSYGIRSSRKLERACHHNLSFIWLVGGLKPDYRTIARFRLDNRESIIRIMKQCARFCIENELIEGVKLFVDGSMLRANASLKNHWDLKRCEQALKKIDERIEAIVNESEQIDESEEGEASAVQVNEHLRDEKDRKERIEGIVQKLVEKEEHRDATQKGISYNTTDEECIRLKKKDGVQAGYNAPLVSQRLGRLFT